MDVLAFVFFSGLLALGAKLVRLVGAEKLSVEWAMADGKNTRASLARLMERAASTGEEGVGNGQGQPAAPTAETPAKRGCQGSKGGRLGSRASTNSQPPPMKRAKSSSVLGTEPYDEASDTEEGPLPGTVCPGSWRTHEVDCSSRA